MKELYDNVLEFVKNKHKGQIRRSGEPVINHPIGVANILKESGYGLDYQIIALLHDTLEDTDTSIDELLKLTNNKVIVSAVISLTKFNDMSLEESIINAKNNIYGRVIKGADRLQNAMTTYSDKNSQEFISGFIVKTIKYYIPALLEIENIYTNRILNECFRLYDCLCDEAKEWVSEQLMEDICYIGGKYYD